MTIVPSELIEARNLREESSADSNSPVTHVSGDAPTGPSTEEIPTEAALSEGMLDLEAVQRALNRSRASIYRYSNTDPENVNPPFNPKRLNPEYRQDPRDSLMFHPNEVARFAQDVLKIKQVKVEVLSSPHTATQNLLEAILGEMKAIRSLLEGQDSAAPGREEGSQEP